METSSSLVDEKKWDGSLVIRLLGVTDVPRKTMLANYEAVATFPVNPMKHSL